MSTVVACPGCQSPLKAPPQMAGRRAKCKRCGASFRVPGQRLTESAGDSQMLSTIDLPQPTVTMPAPPAAEDTPMPAAPAAAPAAKVTPKPATVARKSTPKSRPVPATPLPLPLEDDLLPASPIEDEPLVAADLTEEGPGPAAQARSNPAPTSPADPFAFSPVPAGAPAASLDDAEEAPLVHRGRSHARGSGGGSGKLILLAGLLMVAVLAAGIGGVVVYMGLKKDTEVAKADPKDNKKADPKDSKKPDAQAATEPGGAASDGKEATSFGKDAGKGTARRAGREPALRSKEAGAASPAIALAAGKIIKFDPPSAAPQPIQKPTLVIVTDDIRLPTVRGVFPPQRKEVDPAVLWQAKAGFQGQGEKLNLDLYSPQSLKRVGRVEVDGDGAANPICDLAKSADLYAHAANGKITVYNTREKATLLAGFDPYADKPDHKKAGLAAIYLTEPPDKLITVSTAGAVHVWAIAEKKMVGEYISAKGVPGKVAAGKAVAADPGRTSIVVAVGGAIHRVTVEGTVAGAVVADLGGNVGQSLGLASGGGQLLYVFETEGEAKKEKEKAVMLIKNDGKTEFYRWPDKVGEPVSVGWAGDQLAVVGTGLGSAVWFEFSEGEFKPIALVKTPPADRVRHATSDDYWVLLPDKGNPNRSILAQYTMPPQGLYDLSTSTKRPTLTLSLDEKALAK